MTEISVSYYFRVTGRVIVYFEFFFISDWRYTFLNVTRCVVSSKIKAFIAHYHWHMYSLVNQMKKVIEIFVVSLTNNWW